VVKLVQVVLAGEDGPVGEHLRQDAADGPHVNGFCVSLGVEHDLGRPVPPGRHVLRQEARVVVFWVGHSCQPEVAYLEITRGVQQQVTGLQVPVEDIGRVNVLEAPENLIKEVANVVITQPLRLKQLVEVSLHETLNDVDVLHGVHRAGPEDVPYVNNVFMIEPG